MKYLSEDILNKYIDNELSLEETKMVEKILKSSPIDNAKFTALRKIHKGLGELETTKLSDDFTSNLMVKLKLKYRRDKKQKRFIIMISSFMVALIVGFTGTALYETITSSFPKVKNLSPIKNFSINTDFFTKNIGSFFSYDKISIIGISISLVIIISLYFLLEEIKKTKHRLNKIQ